jgi:hypothetical protein
MNTRNKLMTPGHSTKQLWIGMVEVRPLKGGSKILGDTKGAFVNIITWSSDAEQYKRNVEQLIGDLGGLFVSEIVNAEPVEARRTKTGGAFEPDIEDMISRAQGNPNAILYGTFHTFERDNA